MRPQEIKSTIRAGFFVTILLLLGGLITFFIGKENSLFDKKTYLETVVKNAEYLKSGAPVLLKGLKIGRVLEINMKNLDEIIVKLEISESYRGLIKTDSFASIKTQGMLGDKYIEILGGSNNEPILPNDTPLKSEGSGGVTAFIDKGQSILENANKVLSLLGEVLADVNQDRQLRRTFDNINKISGNLEKISRRINESEFLDAAKHLSAITKQIKTGPGTLHSLIYDDSLHEDVRTLVGGAHRNKVLKYFIRESIKNSEKIKK